MQRYPFGHQGWIAARAACLLDHQGKSATIKYVSHFFGPKSGTPWHGTARRTRRFMARPGTENHGPENLGTARHGKSWHGKILARHGTENLGIWTRFRSNSMIFEQIQIPKIIYVKFQISGKLVLIRPETIFPKVVRLEK